MRARCHFILIGICAIDEELRNLQVYERNSCSHPVFPLWDSEKIIFLLMYTNCPRGNLEGSWFTLRKVMTSGGDMTSFVPAKPTNNSWEIKIGSDNKVRPFHSFVLHPVLLTHVGLGAEVCPWGLLQLRIRWQQQAVCTGYCTRHCYLEPQPTCQNPIPSLFVSRQCKVAPLLTCPGEHVLWVRACPSPFFGPSNKAFLCFWIEFSLILLTLMIPGSRTHCWSFLEWTQCKHLIPNLVLECLLTSFDQMHLFHNQLV